MGDAMGDNERDEVEDADNHTAAKLFEQLKFDEVKKLGQGGMGIAYRARSLKDGTIRVLKVNLNFRGSPADDEDLELLEEGKLLKSLLRLN